MKNTSIILLVLIVFFMSFKRVFPIQQQSLPITPDSLTVIKINGKQMECKTILFIDGEKHVKIHDVELTEFTKFGFVSKAGQRVEIKVWNYDN